MRLLSLLALPWLTLACTGSEFGGKTAQPSAGASGSAGHATSGAATGGTGNATAGGTGNATAGTTQGGSLVGPEPGGSLTIPDQHPRLYFNAARLERARAWFRDSSFEAAAASDAASATDAALHYLLAGDEASARSAITWALGVEVDTSGNGSDIARWDGEAVILVYDWCYPALTSAERTTLLERWNGYLRELNQQDWGGVGMEGNNYYLGNVRNTLEWGIATHGEGTESEEFLAYALDTRWRDSFLPYAGELGKGGVMHEGSAYGRRVLGYWTVPLVSAELLGRNMWDETPFFRESLYWLIYSTTPGPTEQQSGDSSVSVYETWPSNEDERWLERDLRYNTAQTALGDYMTPLLEHYQGLPLAGYVASFLEQTKTAPESRFVAALGTDEPTRALSELPLDYFAEGLGMAYAKTSWTAAASAVQVQVSTPVGVGHSHLDAGTFQLWRKGHFLTRETVGYAQNIAGYADSAPLDCRDTVAHNGLLYDGRGSIDWQNARPTTQRLASGDDYFYIAMDLTGAYEIREDQAHRETEMVDGRPIGNPSAGSTVRELLFIKPLETLVVLDRMESDGPSPADVTKTFLVHFPSQPSTPAPNVFLATAGDQSLRVTSVLPAQTQRRVVVEGGQIGQFRAEIESSGSTETLFLHVLELADTGAPALQITIEPSAQGHRLTLNAATRGSAVFELAAGLTTTGGSFGYAASGAPALAPLRSDVQPIRVECDGVEWL